MVFNGPTLRAFTCPECNKRRLYRPRDHVVSHETRTVEGLNGETITHFIDVCSFCVTKLNKRFNAPGKGELKKVLEALHDPSSDLGDKSLEELL